MKFQYDCPHCGTEFEIEDGVEEAKCECCKSLIAISPDFSFEEGRWRDCTTVLLVQKG